MDFNTIADFSEDLNCSLCTNLLSHFPIYISTNNSNICGRCAQFLENTPVRNTVYEAVAQFLKFPCRYMNQGCTDTFLPKDIPNHEKVCVYRVMKCPTRTQCNWEGTKPLLMEHCWNEHFDIILKNGEFEIDLLHSSEGINLLVHNDTLLIVERKFDQFNKMLQCAVYHLMNEVNVNNYLCHLTMRSGNRNVSVDFYTTSFENINFTELYLESLKSQLPVVSGKIVIGETVAEDESFDNDKLNMDMLSVLKCSLCSKFAIPPIHQCVTDESIICSDCRGNHVSVCDNCLIGATRNIGLDKMATLLNYPCKNEKNGCDVVRKPELIKKHHVICQYGVLKCPLNDYVACEWNGFGKDIIAHVESKHRNLLVSPKEEIRKHLISLKTYLSVIKFANRMFRVVCAKIDERVYWSVQSLGYYNKKFKYEIEVVDLNNCGERLLMKQTCAPLVKRKQFFKYDKYYCYLHSEQIKRLVSNGNVLAFKVHIFRS